MRRIVVLSEAADDLDVEHETRVVAVLDLRRHPSWIRKQVSRRR